MQRRLILMAALVGLLSFGTFPYEVFAEGTETLGPASITIQTGTEIVAKGVGLMIKPNFLNFNVPLNTTVKQVLLYWNGMTAPLPEGPTRLISVNGNNVTGILIGGPTDVDGRLAVIDYSNTYRADITALGLVHAGANSLLIDEVDFLRNGLPVNNGAGVLVIYDDGISPAATIQLRDGQDAAYFPSPPPLDTTVPQTYVFPPAAVARTADLDMFFASIRGTASGGSFRPTTVNIWVNNVLTTQIVNVLNSNDGEEWDTLIAPITIPPGATSVTVQALSPPFPFDNVTPPSASFVWTTAALSIKGVGANNCGLTWGYWKNHTWPANSLVMGGKSYNSTELASLLALSVTGDASVNLAHQLIAAKFNVLNGTNVATANGAITTADNLLALQSSKLPLNVDPSSTLGQQFVSVAALLEYFNKDGIAQPGCTTSAPADPTSASSSAKGKK